VLIGWFCAGVMLQSVVLARDEWKDWRLPACIVPGLLALIIPNSGDPLGTPDRRWEACSCLHSCMQFYSRRSCCRS